jgi:hypothetical protein
MAELYPKLTIIPIIECDAEPSRKGQTTIIGSWFRFDQNKSAPRSFAIYSTIG